MASTTKTNGMTEREFLTAIVEGKEITAEMITKAQILEMFEVGTVYTAKEIADTMGFSTQKASALLKQLVTAERLEKSKVKAKFGKVIGYSLIPSADVENES